jgi:ABC-type glycerol-3-phosphate transport system substrate-binding protein
MKKLTAFILGCLFLISALTACAGDNKTDDTTAPAAITTQAPDETTSNLDSKGYLKDSLPEISFGDTEFSILYWSDREHEEFVATEQTGEAINDAIYARNASVETRAGVKLNFVGEPGNASNVAGFTNKVKAIIDGGQRDLDMIGTYSLSAGNLAVKGYLSDLRSMEYLDWEKPWWPDSLIEDATIKGKLFFASGDISANVIYMMYVTFFNRDMITDRSLPDPYALVQSNEWTIDKMFEMCEGIYEDSDGSGSPSLGDTYGQYAYTLHLDIFACGSGMKVIDPSGDELVISDDWKSEKMGQLAEKVAQFFHSNDRAYLMTENNRVHQWFSAQKSLFWNDRCRNSATFKENEVPFGVIPNPKYDTDQEKFYTLLGNPISIYGIPCDIKDEKMSAYVLECYASESYRNISPALYEVNLKYRYTDDAISAEMYDIIRSSVVFDLGRIFATALNTPYSRFQESVRDSKAWSTILRANEKSTWKRGLDEINAAFSD